MEKKYTVTLRLSYQQYAWLGAQEHIHIIRQLIGESTNLNQLARQANTYGFFAVADRCKEMAQHINLLIKRLKDDR